MNIKEDRRYKQANKEALISIGLYIAYFLWWYFSAYGLGSKDPSRYTYVMGLPSWFFYSCIAGYVLITAAVWVTVKFFFKDLPLDAVEAEANESNKPAVNPTNTSVSN